MVKNIAEYKNKGFMIYNVYFNIEKTLSEGRKYSKNLCVKNPKNQEIRNALEKENINFVFEQNKKLPRDLDKTQGRFIILTEEGEIERNEILKKISYHLKQFKEQKTAEPKNTNPLGLVRKKKGKKK